MYSNLKIMTATAVSAMMMATASFAVTVPSDLTEGAVEGATAFLFDEAADTSVGSLTVDFLASDLTFGTANSGVTNFSSGSTLAAGTYSSFLIHFDPDIDFGTAGTTGTFDFEDNIVAIIVSNGGGSNEAPITTTQLLAASDAVFGAGTTYDPNVGRRTETQNDTFTLDDANTLSFFLTTNAENVDNIRVITAPEVPLPAGGLLLIGGLGALALQRRRRKS